MLKETVNKLTREADLSERIRLISNIPFIWVLAWED